MLSRLGGAQQTASVLAFFAELCERPVAPVRHVLGYESEIRRRVLVNQEPANRVAEDLGFEHPSVIGAAKLFESGRYSPERLACVVMLDWGMEDEDIAQIFGRSVRWAQVVRSQADEIRADEPIPEELEYVDAGLQKGDPSPEEILRRAREVRGPVVPGRVDTYRPGIRQYAWRGTSGTLVPFGVA